MRRVGKVVGATLARFFSSISRSKECGRREKSAYMGKLGGNERAQHWVVKKLDKELDHVPP